MPHSKTQTHEDKKISDPLMPRQKEDMDHFGSWWDG